MTHRFTAAGSMLALVATALLAAPAFAKDKGDDHPGKGHGHGKNKHGEKHAKADDIRPGSYFREEHREHARKYYHDQYAGGGKCPPGLAKKNNGCMPPGQAKKWNVGQPLPSNVVVYQVPRPVLVQLPPAPYGYHYARVGGDIVLLRNQGNLVVDIILNVFG